MISFFELTDTYLWLCSLGVKSVKIADDCRFLSIAYPKKLLVGHVAPLVRLCYSPQIYTK